MVFAYFKNVKVKSVGSINEVQSARCDWDGELVVEDLAVQLPLEHLWFPGLPETIRHLRKEIQKSIFFFKNETDKLKYHV